MKPYGVLKKTAEEDFHSYYTEINLRPFSDKQVNEFIDGLLVNTDMPQNLRSRILDRAAGNPLFVEEVIRSLIENQVLVAEEIQQDGQITLFWHAQNSGPLVDIPDNLHALLSARIDRLEEKTRQILQTAAVIGPSFYRRVLEAIEVQNREMGQEINRRLDILLQLGMIHVVARLPDVEYKFNNPLTQEVAYRTILLKRRRDLHQKVGQVLEELFPDQLGEFAPLLAYHFAEGGIQEKAFDYYILAGDSAARLFANIEARDHYSHALDLVAQVDTGHEKLEALFTGRGRVLELLSHYEDALANYESMLQLARNRKDERLELAAVMAQATIRSIPSLVFDDEISLQLSQDALTLARDLGERSAEAKIHWNLMLYYQWARQDFGQAVDHGEAAVEAARKSSLPAELGPILNDLAISYFGFGRLDESLEAFEESRAILRNVNNLPLLALNLTNSSTVQFLTGHNTLALDLMEEAERINRSIENYWGLAGSLFYRGLIHLTTGNWGESLKDLNASIEFCEIAHAEMLLSAALMGKATYCMFVNDTETAFSTCREAMILIEKHLPYYKGYGWGLISGLYLMVGDQDAAQKAIQTSLANLDLDLPPTPTFSSVEVRMAEIRFLLAEDRLDMVVRRADDLLDYLKRFHIRQFRSSALLFKGKALLSLGQAQKASVILNEVYDEAEALSTLPDLWQILAAQADALERLGELDHAVKKREQAVSVLSTLAGSIVEDPDRDSFLNLPDVRWLMRRQD